MVKAACAYIVSAVTLVVLLAGSSAASLTIDRMVLYFDNYRPEMTVERNAPNLRAHVDIHVRGTGFLRGYWDVGGRHIAQVNQPVAGTGVMTETITVPSLPTFDPGIHVVRFVVTEPLPTIPVPAISYFVLPSNTSCGRSTIKGIAPVSEAEVPFGPLKFSWEPAKDTSLYVIGFYDDPKGKPVFSAYTKEPVYEIADVLVKSLFKRNKTYYWNVRGFDAKNNMMCEQDPRNFSFK